MCSKSIHGIDPSVKEVDRDHLMEDTNKVVTNVANRGGSSGIADSWPSPQTSVIDQKTIASPSTAGNTPASLSDLTSEQIRNKELLQDMLDKTDGDPKCKRGAIELLCFLHTEYRDLVDLLNYEDV